jgi:hypothetical protein
MLFEKLIFLGLVQNIIFRRKRSGITNILHYGPGVDSTSNRNEYQEYLRGDRAAGA